MIKTINKERIEALRLLINLVNALKDNEIENIDIYDSERKATYFLQDRKLSPYRSDHQENIKQLFEDNENNS